jgi:hypothetical protein
MKQLTWLKQTEGEKVIEFRGRWMDMLELLEFSGLPITGEVGLIMLLPKLNNFEKIWAKDPKTSEEAFEIALELEGLQTAIRGNKPKRFLTSNKTLPKVKVESRTEAAHIVENRKRKRRPVNRAKLQCYKCRERGHFASECKKPTSNMVEVFNAEDYVADRNVNCNLFAINDETNYVDRKVNGDKGRVGERTIWVMDSGASKHMTSDRDLFSNYKLLENGRVVLPDSQEMKILGCGELYIRSGLTMVKL